MSSDNKGSVRTPVHQINDARLRRITGKQPPGGDDLEARVAKLEAHFEYIRRDLDTLKGDVSEFRTETKTSIGKVRDNLERDFRLVFGVVIVVALGLAGLMAKGFHWI